MRVSLTRLAVAAAACLTTVTASAAVNLFVDPSFEALSNQPALNGVFNHTPAPGSLSAAWSFSAAPVLQIGTDYTEGIIPAGGPLRFQAAQGSYSVDLTGSGNQGFASVYQVVNLAPGDYRLTFDLGNVDSGDTRYPLAAGVEVFLNNGSFGTFANTANTQGLVNWATQTVDFTVLTGGNTEFRFTSTVPVGDNYSGLDNVSVTAVPEPHEWAMMLVGLGLVGWVARRRARTGTGAAFA
jgi:hypothetical protein